MKKILLGIFTYLLLSINTYLQAQNPIWSLPPNYIKNNTPQPLPQGTANIVDYQGAVTEYASNSYIDASGNLLFFIVDGYIFDKHGREIDQFERIIGLGNIVKGHGELVIFPNPDNCQQFYIATCYDFGASTAFLMEPIIFVLDMGPLGKSITGREGGLISYTNLTTLFPSGFYWNSGGTKRYNTSIAASELLPDNSRVLLYSNGARVEKFKIKNNNILRESPIGIVNSPLNPPDDVQRFRSEMELIKLSNGNYRLAVFYQVEFFVHPSINFRSGVSVVELDANLDGGVIGGDKTIIYQPTNASSPIVHGLEFSPSGQYLYITHTSTVDFPLEFEVWDVSTPFILSRLTSFDAPFVQNNLGGCQFSQIELAIDGKIYFSKGNTLISLSNPNTPNPSNFNYNTIALNHHLSQISTNNQIIPEFNSYLLPDQVDLQDYFKHYQDNKECCVLFNTYDHFNYTQSTTSTYTGMFNHPLNPNNDNEITIQDELRIPAGVTLTLKNMSINFAPTANVVIERGNGSQPGGRLILDNTTFTIDDRCGDDMWMGVEVYGYQNLPQIPYTISQQGKLEMINGSIIEHAKNAAYTGKIKGGVNNTAYAGGVIKATNSFFYDNITGVSIYNYQGTFNNNNVKNVSGFTNTVFETRGSLKTNVPPQRHATLVNVDGIIFTGCDFLNSNALMPTGSARGNGIFSINADFTVNTKCSFYPCSNGDRSTFANLNYGIYAVNSLGKRTIRSIECKYTNNHFGIYKSGVDNATIIQNDFEVYKAAAPNPYIFNCVGLYMNGCTGYQVEENEFTDFNDPLVSGPANTYGIIVRNSGTARNTIYRNEFHDIKIGGQSEATNATQNGITHPNDSGLQWICNRFYNNLYEADLTVTSGQIEYQQGRCLSPIDPNYLKSPAGNRFSHTHNGAYPAHYDIFANPTVLTISYDHHADAITTPDVYSTLNITTKSCFNTANPVYFDPTKSCPSKINTGKSKATLFAQINQRVSDMDNAMAANLSLIDGGNTAGLLNQISSTNGGNLKNLMMQYSPYLSDTVLIAFLAKNPSSGHIKQVILANSPLSQKVMDYLNGMNLPAGIKNQINASQAGNSPMQDLAADNNYFDRERYLAIDEKIRFFLNDTNEVAPLDSIKVILEAEADQYSTRRQELCELLILMKDTSGASDQIDTIGTGIGGGTYSNPRFTDMASINNSLAYCPDICTHLRTDSALLGNIGSIAYDPTDRISCVHAEALLMLLNDSIIDPVAEPLVFSSSRIGSTSDETQQKLMMQNNIKMYPNPTSGSVFVVFNENSADRVVITNSLGQVVLEKQITTETELIELSVQQLPKGIYIINIYNHDKAIYRDKLMKE